VAEKRSWTQGSKLRSLQNCCGRGAIAAALFGIFLDRGASRRMRLQAEVPTRYTSKEDDAAWIALHAAGAPRG
jgi:hypothetical protein